MTKLTLKGSAGQGVKLISIILANILKDQKYEIALTFEYSPLMRSGGSNAYLIFSKHKIDNPLIGKSDLEYNLCESKLQENLLKIDNNKKFMNMVLLGLIIKKLNIKLNEKDIKQYLPSKFLNENLNAIKKGYFSN